MKLAIAAGGTGGHLFPGIAVAEVFKEMNPAGDVLFIGSERGLEKEILEREGLKHEALDVGRIKGEGFAARMKTMLRLPKSLMQARSILNQFQPDVVFGIGGYSSGPVILAACLSGIPRAILEPNAIPGFTNRALSRFVNRIFIAFPEAERFFVKSKTRRTGTPVRKKLSEIGEGRVVRAGQALPGAPRQDNFFTVLVFGGSQGATALNRALVDLLPAIEKARASGKKFRVIHQTGKNDYDEVKAAYDKTKIPHEVMPFFENMDEVYAACDLVVSRAGASTLSELAAAGIPSILVPYPFAADDHQRFNAKSIADAGGAEVILNQELGEKLGERLFFYEANRGELRKMSDHLKKSRGAPAAEAVARELFGLMIRGK